MNWEPWKPPGARESAGFTECEKLKWCSGGRESVKNKKDRGGKERRRGEDEREVGDGGAADSRHCLPGDHVPQTDAPAGPDRHHRDW